VDENKILNELVAMLLLERTTPMDQVNVMARQRMRWMDENIPENRHSELIGKAIERIEPKKKKFCKTDLTSPLAGV
jgi:hypothetical protein